MSVATDRELTKRKKKTPTETAVPLLLMQCRALKLPEPVTEHRFHPVRMWRIDAAFVDYKLAVEIDGGGFIPGGGHHSRGLGIEDDCEKYAELMLRGWRLLRTTPRQVKRGITANWLVRFFTLYQKPSTPSGVPHVAAR